MNIQKSKLIYNYRYKYYSKIVKHYDLIYFKLKHILLNIPYNNISKKLKKHFPVNYFNTFDEYKNKKKDHLTASFSILLGDIELQKKIILDTIDRRYNTIQAFSNNLKYSIMNNLIYKNLYNLDILDLSNFKDDIIYYNTTEKILNKFPNFINKKTNKCELTYVFSIKTENIHHYIDLKNMSLCDRILIIGNDKNYNIMFETNKIISPNKINEYIKDVFDNKLLQI